MKTLPFFLLHSGTLRENWLSRRDPKAKTLFVIGVLLINLLSDSLIAPLLMTLGCIAILFFLRASLRLSSKTCLLRFAWAFFAAFLILFSQLLWHGETPFYSISWHGMSLSLHQEGLQKGLAMALDVLSGLSLLYLLSLTTSFEQWVQVGRAIRLPWVLMELLILTYSFLHLLWPEAQRIQQAQRQRLGYWGWRASLRSLSILAGMVFMSSMERVNRLYEAMRSKGYKKGRLFAPCRNCYDSRSLLEVACALGLLLGLVGLVR